MFFNKKYKVRIADLEIQNRNLRDVIGERDSKLIESFSEIERLDSELQTNSVVRTAQEEELSQAYARIKFLETPPVTVEKKPVKKITKKLKIK